MDGTTLAVTLAMWTQGMLTLAIGVVLGQRRIPRVLRGEIAVLGVALDGTAWPADARQASNAFSNQFELPVLFFIAGIASIWLGATLFEAALVVAFVASRIVHAVIHLTSNIVTHRFAAYLAGVVIMTALWLTLGIRLMMEAI